VTPMNQPQPALALAATPAPPRDRETQRLLDLWVQLTYRTASAAAHHSPDETSLRDLQLQVEDALSDRLDDPYLVLDELWGWEAALLHTAETPPEDCLICRKARLGLPADLPLPAGLGGGR
jgi:hypothetical protein